MPRVTLQFLSAQMCRGAPFIVDDASLHAVRFILAQKDGAVAGIGDPGWPERAFNTAGITPKAFGATTSTVRALLCDGNGAHRSDAPYLFPRVLVGRTILCTPFIPFTWRRATLLCYGHRRPYVSVFEKRSSHASRQANATMRGGKGRNVPLVHRVAAPEEHRIRHPGAIKMCASRLGIFSSVDI